MEHRVRLLLPRIIAEGNAKDKVMLSPQYFRNSRCKWSQTHSTVLAPGRQDQSSFN